VVKLHTSQILETAASITGECAQTTTRWTLNSRAPWQVMAMSEYREERKKFFRDDDAGDGVAEVSVVVFAACAMALGGAVSQGV